MRELDRERYRVAFALPLLFLVWANLHGAWVMAGGVLAIWTFVRAAQTPSPRVRLVLLGAGVLSAAATLVNPYGAELWRFLFETVRFARGDIVEWRSLSSTPIMFLPWLATVAIALMALARARREHLSYFAVSLLLGVASFQVIRLVPFFSLSVLVLLGPLLAGHSANARAHVDARGWAGASIIWTICVASSTIGQARVGCLQTRGAFFVDEQAASFLRENQATGRLVVWFDWGSMSPGTLARRSRCRWMDGAKPSTRRRCCGRTTSSIETDQAPVSSSNASRRTTSGFPKRCR
jgi:hypothetical protein